MSNEHNATYSSSPSAVEAAVDEIYNWASDMFAMPVDEAQAKVRIAAIISRHGLSGGEGAYQRGVEAALGVITRDSIMSHLDENEVDNFTVSAVVGRGRKLLRALVGEDGWRSG